MLDYVTGNEIIMFLIKMLYVNLIQYFIELAEVAQIFCMSEWNLWVVFEKNNDEMEIKLNL